MKPAKINLLSKDNFSTTTVGRVAAWSLSVGRWIVIVTELIVIMAFAARFKFDRDIAELTDEIQQKQTIVQAYAPFEKTFRETQHRLVVLNNALIQQQNIDQVLTEIGNSTPSDIVLTSITLDKQLLTIKGTALTEPGMAGMHLDLSQSSLFSRVTLSRVEVEESYSSGIEFEIKATLSQSQI